MPHVTAEQVKRLAAGGPDVHDDDGTTLLDRQTLLSMAGDDHLVTTTAPAPAGFEQAASRQFESRQPESLPSGEAAGATDLAMMTGITDDAARQIAERVNTHDYTPPGDLMNLDLGL